MTAPAHIVADDLHVVYPGRGGRASRHALRGVSVQVGMGETLGIVGESGCGKSTLARALLGLVNVSSGSVSVGDVAVSDLSERRLRPHRRSMQLVFQDPIDALNPRWPVRRILVDALRRLGVARRDWPERVRSALADVGLDADAVGDRLPHQLSGGQAQRVGIARAIAADPDTIVFDEPTSALDVTVQAQILELIAELMADRPRSYVYISHNLATVRSLCDRVAVLYLGRIVETGPVDDVFDRPLHPYTQALLTSVPSLKGTATARPVTLEADLAEVEVPEGCPLAPRCPFSLDDCWSMPQRLETFESGQLAACWRIADLVDDPAATPEPPSEET